MRRAWMVVGGGLAAAAVGTGAVALWLPGWAAGKIDAARADVEASYGVDIEVGGLEASWWSSFPQVTVTAREVAFTNRAPFEGVPLFRADSLAVSLDLTDLLGDDLTLTKVVLDGGSAHLVARGDRANWSLGEPSDEPSTTRLDLDLVEIRGLDLRYDSEPDGMGVRIDDIELRSVGQVAPEAVRFDTSLRFGALHVGSPDSAWLTGVPVAMKVPFDYATDSGAITLGAVEGTIASLPLTLSGTAQPTATGWGLDLVFGTPGADVATLLSILPHTDDDALGKVQATGTVELAATVQGAYDASTYPGADLGLRVIDGSIAAPGVPGAVQKLNVDLRVERQQGPLDATSVTLKEASWVHLGQPMRVTLSTTPPLSAPSLKASAHGRVDLGALDRVLPTDIGWSGVLDLDADVATKGADVKAASGTIRGKGLASADLKVDQLDLAMSRERVTIKALDLRQEGLAASITGELHDPVAYGLGQGPLGGDLSIQAQRVDLRAPEPAPASEEPGAVVTVPTDLALGVSFSIGEVLYDDYVLQQVQGKLAIRDGAVTVRPMSLRTFGGTAAIDGVYRAPTPEHADLDGTLTFDGLDIAKLMNTVDTVAEAVPVARRARGKLGGTVELDTLLGPDGSPNLDTLFSEGLVLTVGSSIEPSVLKEAAATLGIPNLAALDLDHTYFDYKVEKGRMTLAPTKATLGQTPATFGGSAGVVDHTLDLFVDLTLPASKLSGAKLAKALPKGVPNVDVRLGIKGTYDKPRLTVTTGGLEGLQEQLVDKGKEVAGDLLAQASAQGDLLIAEATKAAAALVAEAKKAASALRSEAKKQGDKLVKQANNPLAKAAAEKAASELTKQADKQADKLEAEADKQGDKLIATAESQKAKLVADAQKKLK